MKCIYHLFIVLSLSLFSLKVECSKVESNLHKSKDRRSIFGKDSHMFSCIRNMKYWNGISCEDYTEKTCISNNYYWDKAKNKCFFTEEIACNNENMYWTGEKCIKHTKETCLEQNMIWNSNTSTCDYEQQEIQYIDLHE